MKTLIALLMFVGYYMLIGCVVAIFNNFSFIAWELPGNEYVTLYGHPAMWVLGATAAFVFAAVTYEELFEK